MFFAFQIHFFNQGRVDAILLCSQGEYAFVDSGFRKNGLSCVKYLQSLGIYKLRYYIGTHAHKNHIGGAAPIISAFSPDEVFIPHDRVRERIIKYAAKSELSAAKSARYSILTPKSTPIKLGEVSITCVGPLKVKNCSPWITSENSNSLILRVDNGDRHLVLLTGDTSASILSDIEKKKPGSIHSEVFKNNHHDGAQPTSLLKRISPKFIVVCNNSIPSNTYRKRINLVGAVLYTACNISRKGNGNFVLVENDGEWSFKKPSEVQNGILATSQEHCD